MTTTTQQTDVLVPLLDYPQVQLIILIKHIKVDRNKSKAFDYLMTRHYYEVKIIST